MHISTPNKFELYVLLIKNPGSRFWSRKFMLTLGTFFATNRTKVKLSFKEISGAVEKEKWRSRLNYNELWGLAYLSYGMFTVF